MRFLVVLSLLVSVAGPAQAGEIRLKATVESAGPLVRLGDVAEIDGEVAADGHSLADLVLFPSPAAGKSRLVRRQELVQLLALCDVRPRDWQFGGAEAVEIKGAGGPPRTIVRPAYHLIPSSSQVRIDPTPATSKPAGGGKADEPPPLVKRSGAVTVHSLAAGVRITTFGKSLADGIQGQIVPVELDDSREKILARVVGPQVVEVRKGPDSRPTTAVHSN